MASDKFIKSGAHKAAQDFEVASFTPVKNIGVGVQRFLLRSETRTRGKRHRNQRSRPRARDTKSRTGQLG